MKKKLFFPKADRVRRAMAQVSAQKRDSVSGPSLIPRICGRRRQIIFL